MMRSMFSGISGLKGFQQAMDVIGNNIANVNTVGFKGGRTTFQSMMQQTIVGAKAPEDGGRGGANALQIGLGTMMSSVDIMMNQGSFQNTGKKTDLGIQGDGFFVLSDGIQQFYTRAGNFMMDEIGHLVQPSTGLKLQGWLARIDPRTGTRFLDLDKPATDLFISAGMTMPAKATTNMYMGGNLNSVTGIEPLTVTVRNPNDPTKTYKVRFTFEKLPPFDTQRIFSSTTIRYTWKAELVDWNAQNPSELPDLNNTTGMIELNQFGQVEKFLVYPPGVLDGTTAPGFDNNIIDGNNQRTWISYSPGYVGGGSIRDVVMDLFDSQENGILEKIVNRIEYNTIDESQIMSEYDTTAAAGNQLIGTIKTGLNQRMINITVLDQNGIKISDVDQAHFSYDPLTGEIEYAYPDPPITNGAFFRIEYPSYCITEEKTIIQQEIDANEAVYAIKGPIVSGLVAEDFIVRVDGEVVPPVSYTYDPNTHELTFTIDVPPAIGGRPVEDGSIVSITYRGEEYTLDKTLSHKGETTTVNFTRMRPAFGDVVKVNYYAQEELLYVEGKTSYSLKGPILNSQGTEDINEEDVIVTLIDTDGISIIKRLSNDEFTYEETTGTVNIRADQLSNVENLARIRLEYATRDSFIGDGSRQTFQLSKKAIARPVGFSEGKATDRGNVKVVLDLQYSLNENERRLDLRTTYPRYAPELYSIYYADPANPQSFDTVDIQVGGLTKASISIPKTGQIKFFDRNDTQNFVNGVYIAPSYTTATTIYDSLGKPYTIFIEFQKIKTNQWAWRAIEDSGIPISYVDDREQEYRTDPADESSIVGGIVEFDSGGRVSAFKAMRQNGQVDDDIRIMRIKFNPGEFVDDGAAPPPEEGAAPVISLIDFSELVQFANPYSATVREQDGNSMGVLQAFAINNAGQVVGTFTNGKSDMLGQLAMAIFNNPAGLMDLGNTLYSVSANSGIPQIGLPGVGGRGMISPGVLEMSNVDLAEEFTGMVIVQRAFQANARTITTVDQILQELVNLKRG